MTTLIMSFARTGLQAMNNAQLANKAVSENSWDPNKLIKESMKARSAEKQMAAAADAAVDVGRSKNRMIIAKAEFEVDKFNMQQDVKKSNRKAGMIAAAGQMIGTGLIKTPDPKKPYQSNLDSIYKEHGEKLEARLGELQTKQAEFKAAGPQYTELPSSVTGGTDPTSSTPGTLTPGVTPASSSGASKISGDLSNLTSDDYKNLAYAITSEAGPGKDKYTVAASILNRVKSDRFPNTVKDVIFADGQYEGVYTGKSVYSPEIAADLASPTGQRELTDAFTLLDGRTDFKGQTQLHNRVPEEDPMSDQKGNFYHYYWQ